MTLSRYATIPEQAALAQELINALRGQLPAWTPDESDPGVYWADVTAAQFITYLEQVNTAADANWILTATGAPLRELLRNVGLTAGEDESNESMRTRYFEAWVALNKDTPEYARLLARQAAPDNVDHAGLSFDASQNRITLYLVDSDGEDVGATVRAAVQAYMNEPSRHPIWLDYVTAEVTKTDYTVDAAITYAENTDSPEGEVRAALEAALLRLRRLDTSIYQAGLVSGMWVPGVVNVVVSAPAATLPGGPGVIYHGSIGMLTFTEES